MALYIFKRIALFIPTLFGILLFNFIIIQFVPGGPVDQVLAKLEGYDVGGGYAFNSGSNANIQNSSDFQNQQRLSPELIQAIQKQYGFDKPVYERFILVITNFLHFDFGDSYFRDAKVIDLIIDRLPVSISLGFWSTLLIYLIAIPLGIRKALHHGETFDIHTSTVITIGYAIPSFLLAILSIVFFAGGNYWHFFPMRGLVSDNFEQLTFTGQILDYLWHMILPTFCIVISGITTLTMLTKNSFLDEIHRQYVQTARSKGLSENEILYKHVFRNAMLIVISDFPAAFLGILFTSSLLIEIVFSLDGLGLLGYEAIISRDYPVVFGILCIFTLSGMFIKLLGDILYIIVDPRIDFSARA